MTRERSLRKNLRKITSKVLKKVKFWNQSEIRGGPPVVTSNYLSFSNMLAR